MPHRECNLVLAWNDRDAQETILEWDAAIKEHEGPPIGWEVRVLDRPSLVVLYRAGGQRMALPWIDSGVPWPASLVTYDGSNPLVRAADGYRIPAFSVVPMEFPPAFGPE